MTSIDNRDHRWSAPLSPDDVVFRPGVQRPTAAELMQFSRARVGYKAPEEIIVLDEMPTNAAGKVDRAAWVRLAEAAVNRHLA